MAGVFLFGTLRDDALREVVLGESAPEPRPAFLEGSTQRRAAGATWPFLAAAPGARAEGLLLESLAPGQRDRLDWYEGAFGYSRSHVRVTTPNGAQCDAEIYRPAEEPADGGPWSLADWQREDGGISAEAAREIMAHAGTRDPTYVGARAATIRSRAQARLAARADPPVWRLRSRLATDDATSLAIARPYLDFFTVEEHRLRHARFAGGESREIARAVFVTGDAVTILPYDPVRDVLLLIEQFRAGPFARGDVAPWLLEAAAGRRDAGESWEDCARRELAEETGLSARALHRIAGYYPSPGAVSEFLVSYVALADLGGAGGLHGLATEDEDIRAFVAPWAEVAATLEAGEITNGPLLLSLLWLGANRERLRRESC